MELVNEQRHKDDLEPVSQDMFELLMDRLEKESFFQHQAIAGGSTRELSPSSPAVDMDAVCSVCLDGECHVDNAILFCDLCNLAVHQLCYGVPHIPDGPWVCCRCLHSPSTPVECCLCPSRLGAFKMTADGRWAHVICASWIPEVGFEDDIFLEPVVGIDRIAAARLKLTCYVCQQRGTGACIQCNQMSCYTAFHITCAQQAGLHMSSEVVPEAGEPVKRMAAFCDVHLPIATGKGSKQTPGSASKLLARSRENLKRARKILAVGQNATPVLSVPVITKSR